MRFLAISTILITLGLHTAGCDDSEGAGKDAAPSSAEAKPDGAKADGAAAAKTKAEDDAKAKADAEAKAKELEQKVRAAMKEADSTGSTGAKTLAEIGPDAAPIMVTVVDEQLAAYDAADKKGKWDAVKPLIGWADAAPTIGKPSIPMLKKMAGHSDQAVRGQACTQLGATFSITCVADGTFQES